MKYAQKILWVVSLLILFAIPAQAASIEWKDCRIGSKDSARTLKASCAKLNILEDRGNSSGRKIALNIAMVRAWNKNPKQDPVLYLAGGPGQSAINSYVQIESGFLQLVKDRNILLVDQRGTGQSNPLNCDVDEEYLFKTPTQEQSNTFLTKCLQNLEADTRFYTTSESIKDLEEVRKALDIQQWNLVGLSYGTRKALTYAQMFPSSIRAMVLDGVVPQQEALGERHEENLLSALQLQFNECKKQKACNDTFGDVGATLTELLEQADSKPLELSVAEPTSGEPIKITLTREVLTSVVRMFAYTADNYRLLPLLLDLAKKGRAENIAAQGLMIASSLGKAISLGMDMSIICAEDAPFYSNKHEGENFFTKKSMISIRKQQCEIWPHTKAQASFKQAVNSDIPSLLLSGEFDPVTPPKFAAETALTLSKSQHLIAKGLGHGVFMRGCMPYIVRDFFDAPSSQLDTDCMKSFATPRFFISLMGPEQ